MGESASISRVALPNLEKEETVPLRMIKFTFSALTSTIAHEREAGLPLPIASVHVVNTTCDLWLLLELGHRLLWNVVLHRGLVLRVSTRRTKIDGQGASRRRFSGCPFVLLESVVSRRHFVGVTASFPKLAIARSKKVNTETRDMSVSTHVSELALPCSHESEARLFTLGVCLHMSSPI